YGRWKDVPGFTEERLKKAHATYCGEITMVDAWLGFLLERVENMGLMDNTAIIFTSDHGFYFGEHDGLFGKMVYEMGADGKYPTLDDWDKQADDGIWSYSPLFEEIIRIPLLMRIPGLSPGVHDQLTSAVDVMPTVLDIMGGDSPAYVEGRSLLPNLNDPSLAGREFVVSGIPFANPGDPVRSVDNFLRMLKTSTVTTVTAGNFSLLYSPDKGMSKLFDLSADPGQDHDIIHQRRDVAAKLHQLLVKFMKDTHVAEYLMKPRLELRI
ncbi:MAG: sulfatase-like hydrolase/transferase, partial [Desulfobacterales bacterium]|nr:sulfatase-like hydrolase/transferase [Desulfobacterales bacterium]